jgi:hypothetical protein
MAKAYGGLVEEVMTASAKEIEEMIEGLVIK